MKKYFSALLLILSLLIIFQTLVFASNTIEKLPSLIKKIQPSIVFIASYDEQEEFLQFGSGFFINANGDIITNYHVVQGASTAEIKTSEGNVYPITHIIAVDEQNDVIRLSVDIPQKYVFPLALSEEYPDIGEEIIVYGSPLGLENTVSNGIVSAIRDFPDQGEIIQITAPISPGSSGSPVLNMQGEVVGVATMSFTDGQNLNFAIPSEKIFMLDVEGEKIEFNHNAISRWKSATKKYSDDEEFYQEVLDLIENEEYKEALWLLELIVNTESSSLKGLVYFQIGYCNDSIGNYSKAIEAYKQSISINPDDFTAYNNLGVAYEKLGFDEEAIAAYKEAINVNPNPNYPLACNNLGLLYFKIGRYEEAIESYKQAVQNYPEYTDAQYNLGIAYETIGLYEEAIESYKKAVNGWTINDIDKINAYNNLGYLYGELGLYNDAKETFKEAIRIDPEYYSAYCGLGFTYIELEFYDESKEMFKEAIRINSDLPDGYYGLGIAYIFKELFEEAIYSLKQAISIDSTNAYYHFYLGGSYIEIGDKGAALDEYKILKGLDVDLANYLFDLIFE